MQQYKDLVKLLLDKYDNLKRLSNNRTGIPTVAIFGHQMRFNLNEGFPIVTVKKTAFKSMAAELLWFLRGSTDNNELRELGSTIWDEWAVTEEHLVKYIMLESGLALKELDPENKPVPSDFWKGVLDKFIADGLCAPDIKRHLGQLGPIYGAQWVKWQDVRHVKSLTPAQIKDFEARGYKVTQNYDEHFLVEGEINQIAELIKRLKEDPNSRRHIVSAWNPSFLPQERGQFGKKSPQENVIEGRMSLAPCHCFFEFYTEELTSVERQQLYFEKHGFTEEISQKLSEYPVIDTVLDDYGVPRHRLSCYTHLRSNDVPLGTPFNIASYALLTHMVAQVCNMAVGDLVYSSGNTHIYENQIEPMRAVLERDPLPLPKLVLNPEVKDIFAFTMDDIKLQGYQFHDPIKMEVAV